MRQYTKEGKLWVPGHPMWPNKADGQPYVRISQKQMDKMVADGAWPELYMSVTEYLKVLSSGHLINWALGVGVDAAIDTIGKLKDGEHADVGSLRELCYQAAVDLRNKPADLGTDIHKALTDSLANPDMVHEKPEYAEACKQLADWLTDKGLGKFVLDGNYKADHGFTFEDWSSVENRVIRYGGTSDLIIGDWLIDFKTTKEKRKPYASECAQLAAYNREAGANTVCNLYFSSVTGQIIGEKVWDEDEQVAGWHLFLACTRVINAVEELGRISNGIV